MTELQALQTVDEALAELDDGARTRVLAWANAKYGGIPAGALPSVTSHAGPPRHEAGRTAPQEQEIPGIARVSPDREFHLTVRDPKAKSKLDAAIRLVHLAVFAHEQLLGEPPSSRKVITPILKYYRVYDGNARHAIAKEKGILRNGDLLSLDAHAKHDAEKYIAEVLDPSMVGDWKPHSNSSKRGRKAKD